VALLGQGFLKERGRDVKRGASAPLRRPVSLTFFEGEGGRDLREGLRPLSNLHLPSLAKGREQRNSLLNDLYPL